MKLNVVPSQFESAYVDCTCIYLGTTLFDADSLNSDFGRLNLSHLQESISRRYPVDGSDFSKGVKTCLSVFPSGLQMEHDSTVDMNKPSAMIFYPIRSIIYCGALRFVKGSGSEASTGGNWQFTPIVRSPPAAAAKNGQKADDTPSSPPIFVSLMRSIDSTRKTEFIECHVFVLSRDEMALKLLSAAKKAYIQSNLLVWEFFQMYGNLPMIYCEKESTDVAANGRAVVKHLDKNGYFYAVKNTPLHLWHLHRQINVSNAPVHEDEDVTFVKFISKVGQQAIDKKEPSESMITRENLKIRFKSESDHMSMGSASQTGTTESDMETETETEQTTETEDEVPKKDSKKCEVFFNSTQSITMSRPIAKSKSKSTIYAPMNSIAYTKSPTAVITPSTVTSCLAKSKSPRLPPPIFDQGEKSTATATDAKSKARLISSGTQTTTATTLNKFKTNAPIFYTYNNNYQNRQIQLQKRPPVASFARPPIYETFKPTQPIYSNLTYTGNYPRPNQVFANMTQVRPQMNPAPNNYYTRHASYAATGWGRVPPSAPLSAYTPRYPMNNYSSYPPASADNRYYNYYQTPNAQYNHYARHYEKHYRYY